jgi:hypothetical protein
MLCISRSAPGAPGVLPHAVGVVLDPGEGIEVRVLIGRAFVGRCEGHASFPHLYLAVHRQGANAERIQSNNAGSIASPRSPKALAFRL